MTENEPIKAELKEEKEDITRVTGIEFKELPDPEINALVDADIQEAITRKKREQEIADAVEKEVPKKTKTEEKPIPADIPKVLFNTGAKLLNCDKFKTTREENTLLAKHLTVIFGRVDSRLFSLFIILVVVISKVGDCWQKIRGKFQRKNEEPGS